MGILSVVDKYEGSSSHHRLMDTDEEEELEKYVAVVKKDVFCQLTVSSHPWHIQHIHVLIRPCGIFKWHECFKLLGHCRRGSVLLTSFLTLLLGFVQEGTRHQHQAVIFSACGKIIRGQ